MKQNRLCYYGDLLQRILKSLYFSKKPAFISLYFSKKLMFISLYFSIFIA